MPEPKKTAHCYKLRDGYRVSLKLSADVLDSARGELEVEYLGLSGREAGELMTAFLLGQPILRPGVHAINASGVALTSDVFSQLQPGR